VATHANAAFIAGFSLGETLAVKFKTVDFGALAALLGLLAWRQVQLID